jgi:hypothetical protein
MTTTPPIIDQAEQLVRQVAEELTRVREGECLCCYVDRQLRELGCDKTHRHSLRYRDAVAPRVTRLRSQLKQLGACCCDCELFTNAYRLQKEFLVPMYERGTGEEDDRYEDELVEPAEMPPCAGVVLGSAQPCSNWKQVNGW